MTKKHTYKKGKTPSISGVTVTARSTKRTQKKQTHKRYETGVPILSIKYNGVSNEFVLSIANSATGKEITKFHVDGSQLIGTMGMPYMGLGVS